MRIYVASPWTCKAEAKAAADFLEAEGHTITKKWWEHREVPGYLGDAGEDEIAELVQQAEEDVAGVVSADVFVLLNLEKSEGKAVETGIALTHVPYCVLLGGKSNLFHYLPAWTHIDSIEEIPLLLNPLRAPEALFVAGRDLGDETPTAEGAD